MSAAYQKRRAARSARAKLDLSGRVRTAKQVGKLLGLSKPRVLDLARQQGSLFKP